MYDVEECQFRNVSSEISLKVQKLSLSTLDYSEAYMPLIWQWGKKSHLIEIIQLLEVEKKNQHKNLKNFRKRCSDTLCFGNSRTCLHSLPYSWFTLHTTPGHTCLWPPPALVTQLTEPSACLLWLLLQDYVAKQEYPVVGH